MLMLPTVGLAGGVVGGQAALTVASGKVASDLTNFPLYISLADMPAQFWTGSNRGRDLRASVGGTPIPCDIAWVDTDNHTGAVFVKVPTLAAASSTTVQLSWDGYSDYPAFGSTYGRNAVWSDYDCVALLGITGSEDRTGVSNWSLSGDNDLFYLQATSSSDVNSHNGVTWDGTYYYTTDDNAIRKWNTSWSSVASNTNPIGDAAIGGSPTINHCGDPVHIDGLLYIPMECYPASGGLYNAHIGVFRASDLSFVTAYDIHAQAHEVSSIAWCDRDNYLYITDFDASGSTLYKYDRSGNYIGTLALDCPVVNAQGITWWRDHFWISQDANDETIRVDYDGKCSRGNLSGGSGGVGFGAGVTGNYEGIDHTANGLLQLIDPGATERVEEWRPYQMALGAGGGMRTLGSGSLCEVSIGASNRTVFTMGITLNTSSKPGNMTALSFLNAASAASANNRHVIAYRAASTVLAIWDVNNSWLNSATNPSNGTSYRVHSQYNGTTSRKMFINGSQVATQSAISALPTGRNAIWIGAEDADYAELFNGVLGFAYLRNSILSADWLAAEYSNLNAPSSFYSIS